MNLVMKPVHSIAASICALLASEAQARQEYEEFLHNNPDLLNDDISKIQEIEADEANHQLILLAMLKQYDGGISASPDGVDMALMKILKGIER